MSYNRLRRSLPFYGWLAFTLIVALLLIACGGGASGTVVNDDALPTLAPQNLNEPLLVEVVTPTTTLVSTLAPPVKQMPVEVLSEGEKQVVLEQSTVTLHFSEVLLILSDGSKMKCIITLIESFLPETQTQTCQPY